MELPDSARELIESGSLAHLVTLSPDGSPQVSCVWVGLEGERDRLRASAPRSTEAAKRRA
jgi:predicted pyridoxine 5'-phosphate oxidase superfamily flavin-nucleotide-binding protein